MALNFLCVCVCTATKYMRYCHSFQHIISFCLQQNIIFQFSVDWPKCQSITSTAYSVFSVCCNIIHLSVCVSVYSACCTIFNYSIQTSLYIYVCVSFSLLTLSSFMYRFYIFVFCCAFIPLCFCSGGLDAALLNILLFCFFFIHIHICICRDVLSSI